MGLIDAAYEADMAVRIHILSHSITDTQSLYVDIISVK
jgi:hypothetical protein